MLARLLEVPDLHTERLKWFIKQKASKLIVYMYQDSEKIYGNLNFVATHTGFELLTPDYLELAYAYAKIIY